MLEIIKEIYARSRNVELGNVAIILAIILLFCGNELSAQEFSIKSLDLQKAREELLKSLEFEGSSKPRNQKIIINAAGFLHGNFARLIIKTSSENRSEINRSGNQLIIKFDKPIKGNLDVVPQQVGQYIVSARVQRDKQTIIITLSEEKYKIRYFSGDKFIGLDVMKPQTLDVEKNIKEFPKPQDKPAFAVMQLNEELKQLQKQIAEDEKKSLIEEVWSRIFPINKPSFFVSFFQNEAAPNKKPVNPAQKRKDRLKSLEIERKNIIESEKNLLREKLAKLNKTRQQRISKTRQELVDLETIKREGITRSQLEAVKRRAQRLAAAEEKARRERILTLEQEDVEGGTKIIFPWTKQIAAAFFSRGKYIWAVFNKEIILEKEQVENNKFFSEIKHLDKRSYTVIRFKIGDKYDLNQKSEGKKFVHIMANLNKFNWELVIKKHNLLEEGQGIVKNAIQVSTKLSKNGPNVSLDVKNPVMPISLIDMEIGDTLYVIPLYQNQLGINVKRNFVDFQLPQTAQGVLIKEKADGLQLAVREDGIDIFSTNRLNISQELYQRSDLTTVKVKSSRKRKAVLPTQTVFPFKYLPFGLDKLHQQSLALQLDEEKKKHDDDNKTVQEKDNQSPNIEAGIRDKKRTLSKLQKFEELDFIGRRQGLYRELFLAKDEDKTNKRLEIAKYYFSMEMYHESLGVLHDIKINDPIFKNMHEVDLMAAASNYFLGRYERANIEFSSLAEEVSGESSSNEVQLWRWMSDYRYSIDARKKVQAQLPVNFIESFDKFMQEYPLELRYSIGLLVVDSMLRNNLAEDAQSVMGLISYDNVPETYENDTVFLKAKIAVENGEIDTAIKMWESISHDLDDRMNRAQALYELTKIRLINGLITTNEAIDAFNVVGTIWRGDNLELDVLKLIGQLYIQEKQYLEGLNAWRILVTNFPNTKEALFIAGKMKKTFIHLFKDGVAYDLKPFDALNLYFSFRELTPAGEIGDRITQQLTEHFIDADLLDNAADIMNHQIRFRTQGDLKHLLTLKLAKLYVDNKKPLQAIKAIENIRNEDIRQNIMDALRYKEAAAYVILDDFNRALQLLWNDFTSDAQDVRLDIFWSKKNWFGVMDIIEPRIPLMLEEGRAALTDDEVEQVSRLAVAYRMQEEFAKIKQMRQAFGDKITNMKIDNVFKFVTSDVKILNFQDFENTMQLDEIEEFLFEYAFWPSKEWKNIIEVLAPRVEKLKNSSYMNDADRATVVRLAIAYAMEMDDVKIETGKRAKKALANIQRDFRDITINQTTIRILNIFDNKFEPIIEDEIFNKKVALRDLQKFIPVYQSVDKISELNAIWE